MAQLGATLRKGSRGRMGGEEEEEKERDGKRRTGQPGDRKGKKEGIQKIQKNMLKEQNNPVRP